MGLTALFALAALAGWAAWRLRAQAKAVDRAFTAAAGEAADAGTSPPLVVPSPASVEGRARLLVEACAALRTDRDRLAGVLIGMNDGLLMLDEAGRVALVNPALRELLLLPSDAEGKTPLEVLRHDDLQGLLDDASAGNASIEREIAIEGLTPRRLQVRAARLAAERGGGVFAIFVDVTERRRLETMRRDFVANVSHELRTPVTAIRSAAETLPVAMKSDPAMVETFVAVIDRNAARLHALVEDLLDLSRIEAREVRLRLESVPLAPLVAQVLDLFSDRAKQREISLVGRMSTGLPMARVDRRAVERVLTNLVDNALKYSGPRATVQVTGAAVGDHLRIAVEDTGAGIAREHLPRLFERFYRVDAGRSRELGGTGLGLSIVKHLVESMGGSVAVESTPGRRTSFSFTVPRAWPEGPAENPPAELDP